jgi:hypothetical protein
MSKNDLIFGLGVAFFISLSFISVVAAFYAGSLQEQERRLECYKRGGNPAVYYQHNPGPNPECLFTK